MLKVIHQCSSLSNRKTMSILGYKRNFVTVLVILFQMTDDYVELISSKKHFSAVTTPLQESIKYFII